MRSIELGIQKLCGVSAQRLEIPGPRFARPGMTKDNGRLALK
jgi:hypothetical protein